MITLLEGIQRVSDIVAELMETGGTGNELKVTKTIILKDTNSSLREYTAVSGLTKTELTTVVIKVTGGIGINSQKILGSAFPYNRIYYLNSLGKEIARLKINEVSESDINIDVKIELGDSDTVTIVNA
jgi:hypothetical protein